MQFKRLLKFGNYLVVMGKLIFFGLFFFIKGLNDIIDEFINIVVFCLDGIMSDVVLFYVIVLWFVNKVRYEEF